MATKAQLRAEYRQRRLDLPRQDYEALSRTVTGRIGADKAVADARTLFSYIAFGREVDTRPLLRSLLEAGKSVITPSANRGTDPYRCFHILAPDDPLLDTDDMGRDLRPDVCDLVELADIDLFIVPGIAWDPMGYRIGFGGGYFDRLLRHARQDAVRYGLAFEFQVVERVPHDPWDEPVHVVFTESRVLRAGFC